MTFEPIRETIYKKDNSLFSLGQPMYEPEESNIVIQKLFDNISSEFQREKFSITYKTHKETERVCIWKFESDSVQGIIGYSPTKWATEEQDYVKIKVKYIGNNQEKYIELENIVHDMTVKQ